MNFEIKAEEIKVVTFYDLREGDIFIFKEDLNPNGSIDTFCIGIKTSDGNYTRLYDGVHEDYGIPRENEVLRLETTLVIKGFLK